ncbi:hypothetical protein [Streptomyces sp. NPDC102437]|uniref:hypothetical protein n=1 Tax=Streptomyces sp. NPDC102437 TaxID=3366175 RepID=UPI0037FCB8E6
MPAYDDVSEEPQLPRRELSTKKLTPKEKAPESEIAITTTIPALLRRQLSVSLAVHQIKLKDAVAEAIDEWLAKHPPRL